MSFVALGKASAAELLNEVSGVVPSRWSLTGADVKWGSVVYRTDGVYICKKWIIAGNPSADPWGGPELRPLKDIAGWLDEFGRAAMTMVTGACVIVDRRTGDVFGAANGIASVWRSGSGWFAPVDMPVVVPDPVPGATDENYLREISVHSPAVVAENVVVVKLSELPRDRTYVQQLWVDAMLRDKQLFAPFCELVALDQLSYVLS